LLAPNELLLACLFFQLYKNITARQEQNYTTKLTSLQYKRESLLPSTLPPRAQDFCHKAHHLVT